MNAWIACIKIFGKIVVKHVVLLGLKGALHAFKLFAILISLQGFEEIIQLPLDFQLLQILHGSLQMCSSLHHCLLNYCW